MKKFLLSAVACFAFFQSGFAIESFLNTSLAPFQALVDSPLVGTSLSQNDFIVGLERKNKRNLTKLGLVRYILYVKTGSDDINLNVSLCGGDCHHSRHHHHHHSSSDSSLTPGVARYEVVYNVTQTGVGPYIYTVQSITPLPLN